MEYYKVRCKWMHKLESNLVLFCFKKSKSEKNILNRSKKPMKWRRHVSFSQSKEMFNGC